MFTNLTAGSTAGTLTADKQATIQMYLGKSKEYNVKLNDLIQVSNFLASKRASDSSEQSDKVNALNTEITSTFDTLKQHQQILSSENATADLRQRMTEFSEEKNRSANNLLQLYGVLNIVAIGLLLYIYRS
jgi:capsule polysaccharide export protein KpsE/RkpR